MTAITTDRNASKPVSLLHTACGAFIVLWLFVGIASFVATSVPAVVKIGVLGLWFVMAAGRSRPFFGTMMVKTWPLLAMFLISVAYAPQVAEASQYTQGFGYLFIAFGLLCFYSQPEFRRERHLLLGVMAVDFAITGVRTFVALQTDPLLARYLATTEENRTEVYGNQSFVGLGGYGYAYALGAVVLVLLFFAVRSRGSRLLPGLFLAVVVLFELAYVTAIVLVFLLGVIFLAQDIVRRRELRVFVYAAVLLGWVTGFYGAVMNLLAAQTWVTADVQERLLEFAALLSGDVARGSDLGTRVEHWNQSLDTFVESGPFGLSGDSRSTGIVGGHSQWLDLLAMYGLYAALPILFLVLAWRLAAGRATTDTTPIGRTWIYFAVLGFVNPIFYSTVVLTWMFFVPALVSFLGERSVSRRTDLDAEVVA